MNVDKGYVDEPIEEGIDLREEILRLKKERNAVIMAHYYQREEIQQLADYIGDSLALAQLAAKTDAPVIILCGSVPRQDGHRARLERGLLSGRQLSCR